MAVDIKKYSIRLRQICDEYYRNNITYIEYRSLRNDIFDEIDNEQGFGGDREQDDGDEAVMDILGSEHNVYE